MTGEWGDSLLSEALLTRLGELDLRIIGNLGWVMLPIISIIRTVGRTVAPVVAPDRKRLTT